MSGEQAEPIPLAEGVKCPHCLRGVFRLRSRVLPSPDGNPDGVQVWFWKCSWDELLACRKQYHPDHAEMEGAYFAVVNGQVKVMRHRKAEQ